MNSRMVFVKRYAGVRRCYRKAFVHLPDDTLLLVLQYLSVQELYQMCRVCRRFNQLIMNTQSLFIHTSFAGIWPSPKNFSVFLKGSSVGNIEAVIKLGLSYLYNEGVSENSSKKISSSANAHNAKNATQYFCQAESITPPTVAFIWSFIRPPWAPGIMCCKRHVFNGIRKFCEENQDASSSLLYSLGKIISLVEKVDDDENCKDYARMWLEKAALKGSTLAKFELWKMDRETDLEPAVKLHQLRNLRGCVQHNKDAQLELALHYATGNVGNIDKVTAVNYVKEFMASSLPCRRRGIFKYQNEVTRPMRYILVDWLVEVCTMKNFTSHVLHAAVSYVDLYLLRRKSNRGELQLLGIGCLLIASRFYEKNIVTIRESSWLTDNTYSYEQVVRMIGEIMSCLKGETQVLTIPNYVRLCCKLMKVEHKVEYLANYIADLSLLRVTASRYSCAHVGFCCTFLAQLIYYPETFWSPTWETYVPFEKSTVLGCMSFLIDSCLTQDCPTDKQNGRLKAVKERYESEKFSEVSKLKLPPSEDLKDLIMRVRFFDETADHISDETALNLTSCSIASSGYDGDEEDMGELMVSDDDQVMVWNDTESDEDEDVFSKNKALKTCSTPDQLGVDDIERSTPSFLTPSWFQVVVNQSNLSNNETLLVNQSNVSNNETLSVGHNNVASSGDHVPFNSTCSPSNVHRRPLIDVNHRRHSSGSVESNGKTNAHFRPIYASSRRAASENMAVNYP
ncbi:cyclin-F-like isoform X2 [Xenia sp. Carnegie-2017]|uniref:cyclin-F-like isoform X2 n=1 Tax=Xenia sp. Carnegie-2017 TaxID=2897299 RepID=UPI001F039669|nr:cyclin-F-like isoform X2 [Xenia sp. Carnegie-2017]